MRKLNLVTALVVVGMAVGACSSLEQSYDSAMNKFDAVQAKVSDVKSLKSEVGSLKSRVKRVAGR